jgi:hypothetical protein
VVVDVVGVVPGEVTVVVGAVLERVVEELLVVVDELELLPGVLVECRLEVPVEGALVPGAE